MTPIANATPTFPLQMAPTADRGKGFSGIMDFQDSAGRVMGHMQYYVGYIALFMCVLMAGFLVYTYFQEPSGNRDYHLLLYAVAALLLGALGVWWGKFVSSHVDKSKRWSQGYAGAVELFGLMRR